MPRLVRRQPLGERIKAYLDPLDFLLWLAADFDSQDWDQIQHTVATPLGLGLNFAFLIARANTGGMTSRSGNDDVFGDYTGGGSNWWSWLVSWASP
jgi:hypothetical protein